MHAVSRCVHESEPGQPLPAMTRSFSLGHAAAMGAVAALLSFSCQARVANPNLFIAGDGFSLEEALSDARTQRTAADSPNYQVLVIGPEVKRLLRAGVTQRTIQQIRAARRSGAVFSVCQKDLISLGIKPAELLPGVQSVRGFPGPQDGTAEAGDQLLLPTSARRIKSICSE